MGVRPRKYQPPAWLGIDEDAYFKFLARKAVGLRRRDRNRGGSYSGQECKEAIHAAFCASDGIDPYDGRPMDGSLLNQYDNDASAKGRTDYKRWFYRLPTIDHVNGEPVAEFEIVSWQTNDAKGDMAPAEFIGYCQAVVANRV